MKRWRKIHKYLGLLIGLQVLLWISGGLIMSVLPIDMVRGKHLLLPAPPLSAAQLGTITSNIELNNWRELEWKNRLGNAVLKATDFNDETAWLSPSSGNTLKELTPQQIEQISLMRYSAQAGVNGIQLIEELPFEVRHLTSPLYQVEFDDWINTTFYLHPISGEVHSVRSDIWRLYDFFWMLHIMDYETRDDFNHPLLIVVAAFSLFFSMSGIILIYFSIIKPFVKRRLYQLRA